MSTKMYFGRRDKDGRAKVFADDKPLKPRLDLFNHSPTGFEWGYGGSGPAQLALAILADALGDDKLAVRLHQLFKWRIVARLERDDDWHMVGDLVRILAADLEAERAAS